MSDAATTGQQPTDTGTAAPADTTMLTDTTSATTDTPATEQQTQPNNGEQDNPDGKAGESTETKADDADKPQGAPEEYADFSMPEGVELDAEIGGEFKTLAKELNLSQDAAQKFADLGAKQAQKFAQAQADAMAQARQTWAEEARADKEFGGDKFDENLAHAKKAMDTFGSDELRRLLNETGLGNHPEVLRVFVKAGKAISEDRFVPGERARSTQTTAQRLYGNTTK
jgi:hypothetical protein